MRPLTEDQRKLAEENLGLVFKVAFDYARKFGDGNGTFTQDQIESAAQLGLLVAAQTFDPERTYTAKDGQIKHVRFSTYAFYVIHDQIRKALMDERIIRLPRQIFCRGSKYDKARQAKAAKLMLGQSIHPDREDEGDGPGWQLECLHAAGDTERAECRESTEYLWQYLTARQQAVLRMRYWEDLRLEDIGRRLGTTRERARQLLDVTLERVRTILKEVPETAKPQERYTVAIPGWMPTCRGRADVLGIVAEHCQRAGVSTARNRRRVWITFRTTSRRSHGEKAHIQTRAFGRYIVQALAWLGMLRSENAADVLWSVHVMEYGAKVPSTTVSIEDIKERS